MPSPAATIRAQQRAWAASQGIAFDDAGYTLDLNDNLLMPLSAVTLADVRNGDGAELGKDGKRGKMQALHSSSALAINFFEYWRHRDPTPLARALGTSDAIAGISFEQKFPTGLRGKAPNLDVVLELKSDRITAIESKFLEPYGGRHPQNFNPKYFEGGRKLWLELGLEQCQELATRMNAGELTFRWLNAQQLLKHALGLRKCDRESSLWYLWFQVEGAPGVEHAAEVSEFSRLVASDGLGFKAISYHALFSDLNSCCSKTHEQYINYLKRRYFS